MNRVMSILRAGNYELKTCGIELTRCSTPRGNPRYVAYVELRVRGHCAVVSARARRASPSAAIGKAIEQAILKSFE